MKTIKQFNADEELTTESPCRHLDGYLCVGRVDFALVQ